MFIYAIGPKEGPQKIGISQDVNKRLKQLQTGHPNELYVHHCEEFSTRKRTIQIEKKIHLELNYKKLKGEWFDITREEAIDFVTYFKIRFEDELFL